MANTFEILVSAKVKSDQLKQQLKSQKGLEVPVSLDFNDKDIQKELNSLKKDLSDIGDVDAGSVDSLYDALVKTLGMLDSVTNNTEEMSDAMRSVGDDSALSDRLKTLMDISEVLTEVTTKLQKFKENSAGQDALQVNSDTVMSSEDVKAAKDNIKTIQGLSLALVTFVENASQLQGVMEGIKNSDFGLDDRFLSTLKSADGAVENLTESLNALSRNSGVDNMSASVESFMDNLDLAYRQLGDLQDLSVRNGLASIDVGTYRIVDESAPYVNEDGRIQYPFKTETRKRYVTSASSVLGMSHEEINKLLDARFDEAYGKMVDFKLKEKYAPAFDKYKKDFYDKTVTPEKIEGFLYDKIKGLLGIEKNLDSDIRTSRRTGGAIYGAYATEIRNDIIDLTKFSQVDGIMSSIFGLKNDIDQQFSAFGDLREFGDLGDFQNNIPRLSQGFESFWNNVRTSLKALTGEKFDGELSDIVGSLDGMSQDIKRRVEAINEFLKKLYQCESAAEAFNRYMGNAPQFNGGSLQDFNFDTWNWQQSQFFDVEEGNVNKFRELMSRIGSGDEAAYNEFLRELSLKSGIDGRADLSDLLSSVQTPYDGLAEEIEENVEKIKTASNEGESAIDEARTAVASSGSTSSQESPFAEVAEETREDVAETETAIDEGKAVINEARAAVAASDSGNQESPFSNMAAETKNDVAEIKADGEEIEGAIKEVGTVSDKTVGIDLSSVLQSLDALVDKSDSASDSLRKLSDTDVNLGDVRDQLNQTADAAGNLADNVNRAGDELAGLNGVSGHAALLSGAGNETQLQPSTSLSPDEIGSQAGAVAGANAGAAAAAGAKAGEEAGAVAGAAVVTPKKTDYDAKREKRENDLRNKIKQADDDIDRISSSLSVAEDESQRKQLLKDLRAAKRRRSRAQNSLDKIGTYVVEEAVDDDEAASRLREVAKQSRKTHVRKKDKQTQASPVRVSYQGASVDGSQRISYAELRQSFLDKYFDPNREVSAEERSKYIKDQRRAFAGLITETARATSTPSMLNAPQMVSGQIIDAIMMHRPDIKIDDIARHVGGYITSDSDWRNLNQYIPNVTDAKGRSFVSYTPALMSSMNYAKRPVVAGDFQPNVLRDVYANNRQLGIDRLIPTYLRRNYGIGNDLDLMFDLESFARQLGVPLDQVDASAFAPLYNRPESNKKYKPLIERETQQRFEDPEYDQAIEALNEKYSQIGHGLYSAISSTKPAQAIEAVASLNSGKDVSGLFDGYEHAEEAMAAYTDAMTSNDPVRIMEASKELVQHVQNAETAARAADEEELKNINQQIESNEARKADFEKKRETLSAEHSQAVKEDVALQSQMDSLNAGIDEENHRIANIDKAMELLSAGQDEIRSDKWSDESHLAGIESQIESNEARKSDAEKERDALIEERSKAKESEAFLQSRVDGINADIDKEDRRIADISHRIDELKTTKKMSDGIQTDDDVYRPYLNDVDPLLQSLEEEKKKAEARRDDLVEKRSKNEQELAETKSNIEGIDGALSDKVSEISDINENLVPLYAERDVIQGGQWGDDSDIEATELLKQSLEVQKSEAEARRDALVEERSKAEKKRAESQSNLERIQGELSRNAEEIGDIDESLAPLRASQDEIQGRIAANDNYDKNKSRVAELDSEIASNKKQSKQLADEIGALDSRIALVDASTALPHEKDAERSKLLEERKTKVEELRELNNSLKSAEEERNRIVQEMRSSDGASSARQDFLGSNGEFLMGIDVDQAQDDAERYQRIQETITEADRQRAVELAAIQDRHEQKRYDFEHSDEISSWNQMVDDELNNLITLQNEASQKRQEFSLVDENDHAELEKVNAELDELNAKIAESKSKLGITDDSYGGLLNDDQIERYKSAIDEPEKHIDGVDGERIGDKETPSSTQVQAQANEELAESNNQVAASSEKSAAASKEAAQGYNNMGDQANAAAAGNEKLEESAEGAAVATEKLDASTDGVGDSAADMRSEAQKYKDALSQHFSTMSDDEIEEALDNAGYQRGKYDAIAGKVGSGTGNDQSFINAAKSIIEKNGFDIDINSSSVSQATDKVEELGAELAETESKVEGTSDAVSETGGSMREAASGAEQLESSVEGTGDALKELSDKGKEAGNKLEEALPSTGSGGKSDAERSAKNTGEALKKLADIVNGTNLSVVDDQVDSLKNAMNSLGFSEDIVESVTGGLKEMGMEITKVSARMKGSDAIRFSITGEDHLGTVVKTVKDLKQTSEGVKVVDIKLDVSYDAKKLNAIKESLKTGTIDSNIDELANDLDKVALKSPEAAEVLKKVKDAREELSKHIRIDSDGNVIVEDAKEAIVAYDNLRDAVTSAHKTIKDNSKASAKEIESEFKKYKQLIIDIGNLQRSKKRAIANGESEDKIADIDRLIGDKTKEANTIRINIDFEDDQLAEIEKIKEEIRSKDISLDVNIKDGKAKALLSTIKKLNDAEVKLAGTSELDDGFEDAKHDVVELRTEVNRLENELGGVSKFNQGKLDTDQFRQYCDAMNKMAADTQNAVDKVTKAQNDLAQGAIRSYVDKDTRFATDMAKLEGSYGKIAHKTETAERAMQGFRQAQALLDDAIRQNSNAYDENVGAGDRVIINAKAIADAQEVLKQAFDEATQAVKQNEIDSKIMADEQKFIRDKESSISNLEVWKTKNSKVMEGASFKARELANEFEYLKAQIIECNNAADLENLNHQFDEFAKKVKINGLDGLSTIDKLKNKFSEYMSYAAASMGIMEIIQGLQRMAQEVVEVDTAMTGLLRVAEMTSGETEVMFDKMVNSAREYGRTLTDTINATADWVRAGFDENTALGLAEVTAMYQNVSDLDYDEASENLLTSYRGFEKQLLADYGGSTVDAVEHITDVLNELDNQYSVTSAGLGEGLARSASALQIAGNTFEESAAMIGAVTEVTQDPEKAGSAMKILSLRLRGMKGELQELGEETDENVENISKMQGQILNMTKGKVNIFDANGEFKSTYEIMQGIAKVWDDLNSIDQANLLETIAGKHRANDVGALIENWSRASSMAETALNSAGSAAKENERTVNSLQGRINALTATWQTFANTVMESNFLKGLVSIATDLLGVVTKVIDTFGTLPTIIGAGLAALRFTSFKDLLPVQLIEDQASISGKKFEFAFGKTVKSIFSKGDFKFSDGITKSLNLDTQLLERYHMALQGHGDEFAAWQDLQSRGSESAKKFGAGLGETTEKIKSQEEALERSSQVTSEYEQSLHRTNVAEQARNKSLSNVKNLLDGYNDETKRAGMSQAEFANQCAEGNGVLGRYLNSVGKGEATMFGYTRALIASKVAMIGVEAASMAMNAAISLGISFIISKAAEFFAYIIKTKEEYAEWAQEAIDSFESQKSAAESAKSTINELGESYVKLSKGVNQVTGENISLSSDEYSEYLNAANQIADVMPELIKGYDSQGNAILTCAGDLSALNDEYERLLKLANDELLSKAGNVFETFENKYDEFLNNRGQNALSDILSSKDLDAAIKSYTELSDAEWETVESIAKSGGDASGYINAQVQDTMQLARMFKEAGMESHYFDFWDMSTWGNLFSDKYESPEAYIERVLADPNLKGSADSLVSAYEQEMEAAADDMRTVAGAYISNAFLSGDYDDISSSMQTMIESAIPNLSVDFFSNFIDDEGNFNTTEFYGELTSIMNTFNNLKGTQGMRFEAFMDLSARYNNGEVSVEEYFSGIDDIKSVIDTLDPEIQKSIEMVLGIDEASVNEVKNDYNSLVNDLVDSGMAQDAAKEFADSLTSAELTAAVDLIASGEIDLSNINIDELRSTIEEAANLREALDFETVITDDVEWLEKLNTALQESASATGLSAESLESLKNRYQDLDGYDPSTLFDKTANGIKVNREEVSKLEKEYYNLEKSNIRKHLETLVDEYNELTDEINNTTDASKRAQLISEQETYYNKIQELSEYQAQLEGVTGAYQRWIDAQSTPEDYEGYEAVANGRETIQEEIDKGFLGNASREYIDLLSGEDLFGATFDEYYDAYQNLYDKLGSTGYNIFDLFTLNDDGDVTAEGIHRFFEGIRKDFEGSVAKFNEENQKWEYDFGADNLKKIQEEWGLGVEAIQLILEGASSAGYEVDWDGILDNFDLNTSDFESLIMLAESAQAEFNKIKGIDDVSFNFETTNVEEATSQIKEARSAYLDLITDENGEINLEAEGAEQMRVMMVALLTQKHQLSTPTVMKVDTSQLNEAQSDIAAVITAAQNFQSAYENYEIAISTGVEVEEAQAELNKAISALEATNPDIRADLKLPTNEELQAAAGQLGSVKVGATLEETAIGVLETKIQTECTPSVIASVTGLDETAIQNGSQQVVYTAEHTDVDNFIASLSDISKKIIYTYGTEGTKPNPSDIKRDITYTYKTEGKKPVADGTAHVNGTAFANGTVGKSGRAFKRGDWGIKGSGVALGGELGQELVVRDGRFFTIGDKGAEFFNYKSGDIIFNAGQTRQLFEQGKITNGKTRGRAIASGTAFARGTLPSSGLAFNSEEIIWGGNVEENDFLKISIENTKGTSVSSSPKSSSKSSSSTSSSSSSSSSSSKSSSSSSSKSSSSDSADEFEETLDWIEIAIDRIERAISKLDLKANSIFKKWSTRNEALADEIGKVNEEISLQQAAYNRYMQEAKSVGLSESWAKKVREGKVDIETITDEDLKEKIDEYSEWYEKALDCEDAIEELKETEAELYMQRFENVAAEYESMLSIIEHEKNMLDEYINQSEARGWITSTKYYDALAKNEKESIAKLKDEKQALLTSMQEAMASGAIEEESEAWYQMVNQIDEVTLAIAEGETALLEYVKAIREIEWEVFDLLQGRISNLASEADFLIELMSNKKLHSDNGQFTDEGMSTVGLHGANYNIYMQQSDKYAKELLDINKELAEDPYNQELVDRRQEILDLQQESILAAEDERNAIRDLVEEGINLELDALQERIDKHNEALEAQKDLYDYQKKIEESTKNIASLEKQMAAYEDDDSEETRQKVQQLKVDLEEAKADLEEQEYERYINDQEQLLDNLYEEYETILNQRLDNIDLLMVDMIEAINNNADTISSTLTNVAEAVGYDMTDYMDSVWDTSGNVKDVTSVYGDDTTTTVGETIKKMDQDIADMMAYIDKQAAANISYAATSSAAYPAQTTTSNKTTEEVVPDLTMVDESAATKKDTSIKVGDTINAGNAKIYADSYGGGGGKQYFASNPVYTVVGERGDYVLVSHEDGNSGATGWFKKSDVIKEYASGKHNFWDDEIAWTQEKGREFIVRPSDGAILTPLAKGDSVLSASASQNIWDMANNPADFIKENLGLGVVDSIVGQSAQTTIEQNFENVQFVMPNVRNYEEMLVQMKRDRNFQKLIDAMGVDQIAGKSALRKGKSIR